jgi:type IV pilus assembly protein PilC
VGRLGEGGGAMSQRDEEEMPPRRPRPKPKAVPTTLAEGQETFQPASTSKPRSKPKPLKYTDEPRPVHGGPNWFERVLFGRVSSGHLATFCGQFARYQEAGVDLTRSLSSLQRQFSRTALGPVIGRLEVAVRSGESLATAMAREPRAFDNLCLSMMRVAEARGGEPETLKGLSEHYEAKQRMIRHARSAMIYPTIVLIVASAVVLLLSIFVIPKMVSFLVEFTRGKNVELPFPTRVLIAISDFMTGVGWWLVPIGAVASIFGALWAYQTRPGKAILDSLSLYIPVLGKIRKKIETSRFARTLSALLNAGVDVGTSLDLTASVLNLGSFRRAVLGVKAEVMHGSEMSEALEATRCFPSDLIAIVGSGEESGKLPESLSKVADDYEEQVEYMVKNLGNLIQPILMVVMGGIVLFIVLGVILAYLQVIMSIT